MNMLRIIFTCMIIIVTAAGEGRAQTAVPNEARLIGGPCEGCEAVFEFGGRSLSPVDTLPEYAETEPKIRISGTIYRSDGVTPAPDIILYVYQTDRNGVYATKGSETGWARRHGQYRGWMKTGKDGRYTFYTFRPASYPGRTVPAHIHPTILEPNGTYYWLDAYHFDDDPFLTELERSPKNPRGGSSGILTLRKDGDLLVGQRDFVLRKNIDPK